MILIVLLLAAAFPVAQDSAAGVGALPKFSDFPAGEAFRGRPAAVDLRSNPKARTYRTVLREGARQGPNFAGHYTVVIWGCGSACQQFAIVDALSGKVFFSSEVPYVSFGDWTGEPNGLEFQRGSRLLVIYGHRKEEDPKGIFFYTWNGTALTFLRFIPK